MNEPVSAISSAEEDFGPVLSGAFQESDFTFLEVERKGGMSKVRKAKLVSAGETCALKYSLLDGADSSASESFNRELSALTNLEHPNIVRLVGIGGGTTRFLVLEWLEETLVDRILSLGPIGWIPFYEYIGRPLLEAILYAHGRKFVHRDLKPLNVMFTRTGVPKITDFGIARELEAVRLGITFAGAGSHPWTPRENDDGLHSEKRDLYSWAAICVACMSGRVDFKQTSDLRSVISQIADAVPKVTLESCLADDPAMRPIDATALLWDVDEFHKRDMEQVNTPRPIGLEITPAVHEKLKLLLSDEADLDARMQRLFADFADACEVSISNYNEMEFVGATLVLIGSRPSEASPWLIVNNVVPAGNRVLQAAGIRVRLQFQERTALQSDPTVSRANINFLQAYLRSCKERELEEIRRRDSERYLAMLQDIVASRMRALRDLPSIEFTEGRWEGGEFTAEIGTFDIPAPGEKRIVRAGGAILVFEVTGFDRGRLRLRSVGLRNQPPSREGSLQVDTLAQRRALERQDDAVRTIRADMAVLPALKRIILDPSTADTPEMSGRPPPQGLSPDKVRVLDCALGLRQVMVVQGPPGTGKTRLITEVVKQYIHENPGARVLLAAQTHIAIDHVIEKLMETSSEDGSIVRIARADEEKVSEKVRGALLQHCLARWCRATADKARAFMAQRGAQLGLVANEVELSVRLESLVLACDNVRKVDESLSKVPNAIDDLVLHDQMPTQKDLVAIESATLAALTMEQLQTEKLRLGQDVQRLRDELRQLSTDGAGLADLDIAELREWMDTFRRDDKNWVLFRRESEIQVAWLDLLGQLKQFEEIVLRSASVVAGTCVGLGSSEAFTRTEFDLCVIDEASKATATEALIPMVRSRKFLVVGDPRQLPPFDPGGYEVDGYADEEIKETLLDYLIPKLPKECVHELTHQHRMCKSIGELISHAFYDQRLVNQRLDSDRPSWLKNKYPKPVIWIDTQGARNAPQGHSFINKKEQDLVIQLLERLQKDSSKARAHPSVAIIAGYAAQAHGIEGKIQRGSFPSLAIEVNTVDSFQGRESDVCIFSVTLSNSQDYLGFLRSMERLNVALSRPKDLLVIIGDQNFCYNIEGKNPFVSVIDYIEAHPENCETKHESN